MLGETRGNLIAVTPAGESNKGDTSGACLMIFSFRLFQLGYLAVISAECVSRFFFFFFFPPLLSESISLCVYLSACCTLTLCSAALPCSCWCFSHHRKRVLRNWNLYATMQGVLNCINKLFCLLTPTVRLGRG